MIYNRLYNSDFLDNDLKEGVADLIIADPPYFKTKGKFDFVWNSFESYLVDVEKWANECFRILNDTGTLLWYGSSNKIAYTQIILDKKFHLLNNLVWDKGDFMNLKNSPLLRKFAPCTERILMYSKMSTLEHLLKNFSEKNPFSIIIKRQREIKKLSINEVAEQGKFYKNVNHGGQVTNWEKGYNIPNSKQWKILQSILCIDEDYSKVLSDYESLKKSIKTRVFNNHLSLNEILHFKNEHVKSINIDHETVKPEMLTRALITTLTNKDDLIVVPFAGSGTECKCAILEGRKFIGYEIDKKYFDIANGRINNEKINLKLDF